MLNRADLDRISERNIRSAGPRYTPVVDPDAPNLQIASLIQSIDSVSLSQKYRNDLSDHHRKLSDAWKSTPKIYKDLFKRYKFGYKQAIDLSANLSKQAPGRSRPTLEHLKLATENAARVVSDKQSALWEAYRNVPEQSNESREIQSQISETRKLLDPVSDLMTFTRSPNIQLVSKNSLFLNGEWGSGKTHLLCDVTRQRMSNNLPTVFILAHHLKSGSSLKKSLLEAMGVSGGFENFMHDFNALGRAANNRALLIVDGINEGDRQMWKRDIAELAETIVRYPHVALIVSCRNPFQNQILNTRSRRLFVEILHQGFQEIEFDAQREFFNHYGIPTPQVPLLNPEFTRPLFLKILCETFSGLTRSGKSKKIHQIAAGQKGMTKILEDFVCKIGSQIETEFSLPPKSCWRLLKGDESPVTGNLIGVAPTMATNLRDYITTQDFELVVRELLGITRAADLRNFCRRFISEGLLVEDGTWQNDTWVNVLRLPYQRFSDHIICRHLLERYLDTTSEASIRRSFYANRPLGKIFNVDQFGVQYKMPGLASALMLEFPERVKRIPNINKELALFLPKRNRLLAPLIDTFLSGLLWRDFGSFSSNTDYLLRFLIDNGNDEVRRRTLDTLICLASRPGHPYSAEWLRQYLLPMSMPDRDLFWSEFLRKSYSDSTLHRILDWVDGPGKVKQDSGVAENLLRLCSLFLTTTHRPLRDRTTKILVFLGENNPAELFKVTLEAFELNDPYVRERMLAACYGVLMRSWAEPSAEIENVVGSFARKIYDALFAEGAPFATKHILIQDYALGVILLSKKIDPKCLKRRRLSRLKRPFDNPSQIPEPTAISEEECEAADPAIYMDFENYTVGGLVNGRRNYDSEHEEYKGVLRQIKWRMLNLGYASNKFQAIDRNISEDSYRREQYQGGKIDRYGKKYSWVAYFEVCGIRADQGVLPDLDHRPRVAECDIDPSFPVSPLKWTPHLEPIFVNNFTSAREWAANGPAPSYEHLLRSYDVDSTRGPWVLLNSFIQEEAPDNDPRLIFSFLRGFFIDRSLIPELISRLNTEGYPGNSAVPEPGSDYYTFAGEIPWSVNFGWPDKTRGGRALPSIGKIFTIRNQRRVRVRSDRLTLWERAAYLGHNGLPIRIVTDDLDGVAGEAPEPVPQQEIPRFVEIDRHYTIPGLRIELPIHGTSWESYHSTENQVSGIDFVAPKLSEFLGLRNKGSGCDLFDSDNNLASIYRNFGGNSSDFYKSSLIYLRQDLLEKYLRETEQEIVWIIWGERDFKLDQLQRMRSEIQDIWSAYGHIHKSLFVGIPPARRI